MRVRRLGGYAAPCGEREIVVLPGAAGSLLVLDRARAGGADARVLAHLAADEPAANAMLVCRAYLGEGAPRGRCRALAPGDLTCDPSPSPVGSPAHASREPAAVDREGCGYRLARVRGRLAVPELRWLRSDGAGGAQVVSVRAAVGRLESYEPLCAATARAIASLPGAVSGTVLRLELQRVHSSPIVLNRRLRERVVATVAAGELSMSEIAMRCGRIKTDGRGHRSGETSWLGRRVGLLPEGGRSRPTPWIHSEVLGLIARRGLGISPREVEL